MNKSEFVTKVAEKSGLSKADAGKAVDAFLESVTDVLSAGDEIKFPGFGGFEVAETAARKGVNPATKQPIDIPAGKAPKFRPGASLKQAVSGKVSA